MSTFEARHVESGGRASALGVWQAVVSGFCASLAGIGVARFAYTPLLPAIIDAHWFASSAAAYLGAANLAGYLAGALLARPMSEALPVATVLRGMMVLATVALFACALPESFLWFFVWRFCSGMAGGVLMVLAAPVVLSHVPPSRRGLASGVIFMGVGVGIAASGTLVPVLLREGITATWLGLGFLSLVLTAVAWNGWATAPMPAAAAAAARGLPGHRVRPLRALYAEYALNAAGLVPHMIFLVDFVARGLGQGLETGAEYWVLFGLGASFGPLLTGHVADRIGFTTSLRLAYLVEAIAVVLPALGLGTGWLMLSSVVVGAFTPGIVPLALGRVQELLVDHPSERKAAWSRATISFAVLQAVGAYGASYLFASTESYRALFAIGSTAMVLALTVDLVVGSNMHGRESCACAGDVN
ncbi:YbfB/YjiJ family MFS transporter [Rhodanobacter aciditrophus]|uniref:YbfB/YjiJ family MFS transporter n=1 Tax=Rhodanobacter aciditrophus TaxID=1623218 RepID=UPI003CE99032